MKRPFLISLIGLTVLAGCASAPAKDTLPASSGAAPSPTAPPAQAIVIGVLDSLKASPFAHLTQLGAQMAADEINQNGGIQIGDKFYKLELVFQDDGNSPEGGMSGAQVLINQKNALGILGPVASRMAASVSKVCEASQVPMLTIAGSDPAVTRNKKFTFTLSYSDVYQGRIMARFAAENFDSVVIYTDISQDFSRNISDGFKQAYPGQVLAEVEYTFDNIAPFTPTLQELAGAPPQAIYCSGSLRHAVPLVQIARRLGITSTFLGTDLWGPPIAALPEAVGSYVTSPVAFSSLPPKAQAFTDKFTKQYNEPPYLSGILAYEGIYALAAAFARGGRPTSLALRDGLIGLEYEGITSRIVIAEQTLRTVVIQQIGQEGTYLFVKEYLP